MAIQWFPGHMAKAKRQVQENLKHVDIVYELVDARLPRSSQNPLLDEIIQAKPRLLILNKKDLADPSMTRAWEEYFAASGISSLALDSKKQQSAKSILPKTQEVLKEKLKRDQSRGLKPRAIRAMVLGIPNVGKSTFMNRLIGKKIAQTGNRPGVTKGQQWLKVAGKLELLDTPGILWPKFEDPEVGKKLALSGAIKDQLLHLDDVALYGLAFLQRYYPQRLSERYQLTETAEMTPVELLLAITKKRGLQEDYERGSEVFLQDLRNGKLGPLTFDRLEEQA
ncbi:MAG: ribosome biogenesis GTPase YlqF [Enterococcaceae bacterium]|jgi:ribosome biogenesis GTPase A|nr:ribosome biogenesis GTPase YlqF [Enterococcaceae bacterium]MCI1919770.1 ribosome biogenesis GTPase YlqF [Enterococcaceae bacterium]